MVLFHNKYRIESIRKNGRDYRSSGKYFVTICTKNRIPWFGEIKNGIMGLSDIGCVVVGEIQKTTLIRSYVDVDTWIVMPNHVHAIIRINANEFNDIVETQRRCVSTDVATLIPLFRRTACSLGSIIHQIKCQSTKRIRAMGYFDFAWQSRYYDHIICNELSLESICSYIQNNPFRWKYDRNYINI